MAVAEEIQRNLTGGSGRQEDVDQGAEDGAVGEMYMPQTPGGSGSPRDVYSPRVPGITSGVNEQAVEDAEKRLKEQNSPKSWAGFVVVSDMDRAS